MKNFAHERKAEWVTIIVARNELCPICHTPVSMEFNKQKLTAYGRHKISHRELVEDPDSYTGLVTLCHLDCWNGLPSEERECLNAPDYDGLTIGD